jgi:hypothetical protein
MIILTIIIIRIMVMVVNTVTNFCLYESCVHLNVNSLC